MEALDSHLPPSPRKATYRFQPTDKSAAHAFASDCSIDVTTAQLLLQRGVQTKEDAEAFLAATLSGLSNPNEMADRDAAAAHIADAIRGKRRIVVFGDYDVDGTTSAVILSEMIEALGGEVRTLIANRFEGGYGLSAEALARCMAHRPALIVTCDCGSSDHARIVDAKRHGVQVVVVDHHLVPSEPLGADAFLNPHRPDCGFGYKGLCSAGLALSLGAAVRATLRVKLDVRPWLDLVALGTIADVAPLDGDNRRLVRAGLKRLASARSRPASKVLRQLVKIPAESDITCTDVSFRIAPRLNAPGRLGQAELTLRFLRAGNYSEAFALGEQIEAINQKRKELSRAAEQDAFQQVEQVYGAMPKTGVVVAHDQWHRGVVGIVAARLADRFCVPAVAVALDGGVGHGSARSYGGVDVHRALAQCRQHLGGFGGHRAAAGVHVSADKVEAFRAAFCDATSGPFDAPIVDLALPLGQEFPLPSYPHFRAIGPFGEANRAPLFEAAVGIEDFRKVGANALHAKLQLRLAGQRIKGFAPHMAAVLEGRAEAKVVGELRPDNWQGAECLELFVRDVV